MLWFKKKRKKVHRATGPIFKNQLTRTKVFFIPGLMKLKLSYNVLLASTNNNILMLSRFGDFVHQFSKCNLIIATCKCIYVVFSKTFFSYLQTNHPTSQK